MQRLRNRNRSTTVLFYEKCEERLCLAASSALNHVVTHDAAKAVYAADLDRDGDLDIVSAAGNSIAWYENKDGKGDFSAINPIAVDSGSYLDVADLNGDGNLDVVAALGVAVAWYESTVVAGEPSFAPKNVISSGRVNSAVNSVHAVDLDGDGDLDVVSGAGGIFAGNTKVAWYANTNGFGSFGPEKVISLEHSRALPVDIEGDGDFDIVVAHGSRVEWYPNNGTGSFGSKMEVTTQGGGALHAADIDGDGDVDIVSASSGGVGWYANTTGDGTFGSRKPVSGSVSDALSVYAADLDADGDTDVALASYGKIAWYDNTDGVGTFGFPENVIATPPGAQGSSVYAADLDGDADLDVLWAASRYSLDSKYWIGWCENRIAGDANDDGEVQFADFVALANSFGQSGRTWSDGDFDSNGVVNFSDFVILSTNFGKVRVEPSTFLARSAVVDEVFGQFPGSDFEYRFAKKSRPRSV